MLTFPRFAMLASLVLLLSAAVGRAQSIQEMLPGDALGLVQQARGSVVVFHAYASWCPPCRKEFPDVNKLPTLYSNQAVKLIAVSLDRTAPALQKYLEPYSINFQPILIAADKGQSFGDTLKQAGLGYRGGIPYTAIFDRSGKLASEWTGGKSLDAYQAAIAPLLSSAAVNGSRPKSAKVPDFPRYYRKEPGPVTATAPAAVAGQTPVVAERESSVPETPPAARPESNTPTVPSEPPTSRERKEPVRSSSPSPVAAVAPASPANAWIPLVVGVVIAGTILAVGLGLPRK